MTLTSDVKQRIQRSQHNRPNPNNSYKTKKKFTGFYTEVKPNFPFCSLKFPTSPLCANGVAHACLGYISMQITRWKSTTQRTFKCLETRLLNNALALYCLLNQMTQMDKDCDTYNEYICIYGPEIGSYCFSSNSDVGLVENTENIR